VDAFDPARYFGSRNVRPLDRLAQLVCAASGLALADARCTADVLSRTAAGCVVGTMFSGVRTICAFDRRALELGPEYVSPIDFANTVLNAAAGQAAIWHKLHGPNATIAAGGASGLYAIAHAVDLIAAGTADVIVAGGADERSDEVHDALEQAAMLAADVEHGEAAAFVVVECEETANGRGVASRSCIYGVASGHAGDSDGSVDAQLIADIVRMALGDAGLAPSAIGAIGTAASGQAGRLAREAHGLVFTDATAPPPRRIPSVSEAVGETLGASGALQVILTLETLADSPVSPIALVDAVGADGQYCAMILGPARGAQ
jgi:3-oxoacyl-[acyl-carrier-protein] synthase II